MEKSKQSRLYSVQKIRSFLFSTVNCQLSTVNSQKGFTLLLAALIASITLALGASVFAIAQKELTLSSVGRDSQYAFYAADTGAECALYWDMRFSYFSTSTPEGVDAPDPQCDAQSLEPTGRPSAPPYYPYTMEFQFEPNGYCVDVAIEKTLDDDTGTVNTTVRADGFSTGCSAIADSPRALQRSVELHY